MMKRLESRLVRAKGLSIGVAFAALAILAAVLASESPAARGEEPAGPGPSPGDDSPLPEEALASRREALRSWAFEPVLLEATVFQFHLDRRDGSFVFQDRRTGTRWFSSWGRRGFASILVAAASSPSDPPREPEWVPLDRVEKLASSDRAIRFEARSSREGMPWLRVAIESLEDQRGVAFGYELPEGATGVRAVRLLDEALWISEADGGGLAAPVGLGEWIPAVGRDPLSRSWNGLGSSAPDPRAEVAFTLRFASLVKSENPILLSWLDPEASIDVVRRAESAPSFPGRGGIFLRMRYAGPRGRLELRTLGKEWSPVVDGARAYRQVLGDSPALATLRARTGGGPDLQGFLGAAVFRPEIGPSLDFAGVLHSAERLRREVGVDQAAVILRDWTEVDRSDPAKPGLPVPKVGAGGEAALERLGKGLGEIGFLLGLDIEPRAWAVAEAVSESRAAASDWQAWERAASAVEALPRIAALSGARIGLSRLPAELPSLRTDAEMLDGRAGYSAMLAATFGLAAASRPLERDLDRAVYLEGALDDFVGRPSVPGFWPILSAAFGHSVRLGVSPSRALGREDSAAFLAHLLLGEVPAYRWPFGRTEAGAALPVEERGVFAREEGWAKGRGLSGDEIFIRNTFEVASHLARQRVREALLYHRPLTPEGSVRETFFGPDLRIVVNFGPGDYEDPEDGFRLPPLGFFVRHPFILAFHATRVNEVEYESPAFFVVRSLEGKMYLRAEQVLIYHGFGPSRIDIGGRRFDVETESVVKIW